MRVAVSMVFFFFVGLSVYADHNRPPPVQVTPEQAQQALIAKEKIKAAEELDRIRRQPALIGAGRLKASMHDPKSFDLEETLLMPDGTVCYSYRARNGFGALRAANAVLSNGKLVTSESDRFVGMWNKRCANKTGDKVYMSLF